MKTFQKLSRRVAVALPGIALFFAVGFLDIDILTVAFFALVSGLASIEAARLLDPLSGGGIRTLAALLVSAATAAVALLEPSMVLGIVLIPGMLVSLTWIFRSGIKGALRKCGGIMGLTVLISIGFGLLARFRLDFVSPWMLFLPLFICWAGDSMAYFIGSAFGRHKMAPLVSPAKSWEGFAAGIAGSAGGAVVAGSVGAGMPVLSMLIIGAAAGTTAVAGDLLESAMKRDAGLKDSGSLLPGHGGLLDRFDSLLAVVPVTWILLMILSDIGLLQ